MTDEELPVKVDWNNKEETKRVIALLRKKFDEAGVLHMPISEIRWRIANK